MRDEIKIYKDIYLKSVQSGVVVFNYFPQKIANRFINKVINAM